MNQEATYPTIELAGFYTMGCCLVTHEGVLKSREDLEEPYVHRASERKQVLRMREFSTGVAESVGLGWCNHSV